MSKKSIFHLPHSASGKIVKLETGETEGVSKKLSRAGSSEIKRN